MLHEQIKNEIKQAMLDKDQIRLATVRGLVAAFTNELVAKRQKPDDWLTDEEALVVIQRAVKQRQDSIAQFRAGDRADLAATETAELEILKTYLPPLMTETEIEKLAREKIAALGFKTKQDTGKVIGSLMKELGPRADGATVRTVIENLLV